VTDKGAVVCHVSGGVEGVHHFPKPVPLHGDVREHPSDGCPSLLFPAGNQRSEALAAVADHLGCNTLEDFGGVVVAKQRGQVRVGVHVDEAWRKHERVRADNLPVPLRGKGSVRFHGDDPGAFD